MRWRLSGPANRDIIQIYTQGVEHFGFAQVEKHLDELNAVFDRIAVYPQLGRLRHEVAPPARMIPFRSHLIFYDIGEEEILILRIRHGFEDWWSESSSGDR